MKAALKFIMTTVGLLLIGLFFAVALLLTQFEGQLRKGLTYQAGRILQCDVHLEGVRLDWTGASLVFKGVSLHNPEGYTDREAIRIESLTVQPEPLTLFSKTPGIRQVVLDGTQAHLQYKVGTGTNLGALKDHARVWAERQEAEEERVWGRRVLIRELRSEAVSVRAEGLEPPTPATPLDVAPFSVEVPGDGVAISGARTMELLLQGLLRELPRVDNLIQPLQELLEDSNDTVTL